MKTMKPIDSSGCATWQLCLPLGLSLLGLPLCATAASTIAFAAAPLYLAPAIKPNIMVLFDNSQSMDATMSGMVINGDDPTTRGNISRSVLRSVLTSYRADYNWGLTSFASTKTLYSTHAYFVGDATSMVYTNDCVSGISASNAGRRCIANPDSAINGFGFLTYAISGDDANVNDVLYSNSVAPVMYGIGTTGVSYLVRGSPRSNGVSWNTGDFPVAGPFGAGAIPFTPTDAGWLPQAATMPREVWIRRGWGYYGDITGAGIVNERVAADSPTHFNTLISLLGSETNTNTPEIKNTAVFTPLAGSLRTVRKYYDNSVGPTPISQTCQRNFVVMATDGNPTGKLDGSQYNPADWAATFNAGTSTYTFGPAQQDVFTEITALRSTPYNSKNYDIQTYVVGMGDSVANPGSVAALNEMARLGGGSNTAFFGSDATALTGAFQSIVGNIQAKTGASSSVAINGGSWFSGSLLYQAKFSSVDWSGNLAAYTINSVGVIGSVPTWEAGARVKLQDWSTGRQIMTYKPSAVAGAQGIPFRWPVVSTAPTATELEASQITALNKNGSGSVDNFGAKRLAYLRGDPRQEVRNCALAPCAAPQFRNRPTTPLGDLTNSSPVYVGVPNAGYYDSMETASYNSFAAARRTRTPMVYVGGNDGMLHGFNGGTGDEVFAYVPSTQIASMSALGETTYTHRYFVDGSPVVGDVFYSGAWHSLLVSGLRSGGKGLFALDVTNPAALTEANAASVVRWEFQDPDMGYVVGQPLLVKTNNGKWSVLVNGGYNAGNANGHAFLFIIDAETGVLTRKIDTGAGSASSPNGLSAVAPIDTNGDDVFDLVYAGDLDGNLWKFDLTATTPATWSVGNAGVPLLKAQSGQSITGRPDVTKFSGGSGYLVTFGTGRYLATADVGDTTVQTQYGVRDNNLGTTAALTDLVQQSVYQVANGANGKPYRVTTHAVGTANDTAISGDNTIARATYASSKRGWYMNLPTSGERSLWTPQFRGERVIFTTTIPDASSVCSYGGSSWLMELDAFTGNRFDSATFDTNGDRAIGTADYVPIGASQKANTSGAFSDNIMSQASVLAGTRPGEPETKISNTSAGTLETHTETSGKDGAARVMWREVN